MNLRVEAPPEQPDQAVGFEQGALAVLGRLQTALRLLIEETPGDTRRPAELAQTLGIPGKLAWQAHRVAHAEDPLAEASNVPGPAAMRRFLDASVHRGSPPHRIAAVRAAQLELQDLIKHHAGTRGEFETMVSALTQEGSEQIDLIQRRAAFKAQSHILGVQAKTHLACFIYQPSADFADRLDCVMIRGLIGLRRFRRDASWIVTQTRATYIDGPTRRPVTGEPIDSTVAAAESLSILAEFCSKPLPRLRRVPTGLEHLTNIEIVGDGVGNTSSVTCLIGDRFRGASPQYRDEHNHRHISNVRVRTPCEVLIHDVLIHRDLIGFSHPGLSVYSDHRDVDVMLEGQMEARTSDRLPLKESVVYHGMTLEVLPTSDVLNYTNMVRHALERVGWDATQFGVYRCRIEYPVMPSSVVVHFDLPEKPV